MGWQHDGCRQPGHSSRQRLPGSRYNAHINVVVTDNVKVVRYLHKYVYKGPGRICYSVEKRKALEDH